MTISNFDTEESTFTVAEDKDQTDKNQIVESILATGKKIKNSKSKREIKEHKKLLKIYIERLRQLGEYKLANAFQEDDE